MNKVFAQFGNFGSNSIVFEPLPDLFFKNDIPFYANRNLNPKITQQILHIPGIYVLSPTTQSV